MFSLFDVVAPAVPPKLNVLVTDIAADMFDVPVNVKFVAVAIASTVINVPAVVVTIDPVLPNAMERVLLLSDEKIPALSVKLFKSSDPFVSVVVLVEPTVIAS
jgi:hypothetical protein